MARKSLPPMASKKRNSIFLNKRSQMTRASVRLPESSNLQDGSSTKEKDKKMRRSLRYQDDSLFGNQIAPYHALKDVTMKDTWTLDPLSKFTFEERSQMKLALKVELNSYIYTAEKRHPLQSSIMMSEEDQ